MLKNALLKLDFIVTNRCNFRCIHCCFRSGEEKMGEFSLIKIKKTLEEFKKLGGYQIEITGGEPLVRKDIKEIIKIGKDLNLKIELGTNGSLLSEEKLQEFKKLGLDKIAISLDGSKYETHTKIRRINRKTFNKIINNIKQSIQLGFYTKINTVVFKSNFQDLVNITKLAIKLKVNEHGLYYFTPIGRGKGKDKEVVNPLLWLKTLRKDFLQLDDKIKISVEVPLLEKEIAKNLNTSCYLKNLQHFQILPDGKVYPCAIMASRKKPLCNLYQQSLRKIWRNKKEVNLSFLEFRDCVDYHPGFSELAKSNNYQFVCPYRKFRINDLLPKNKT